MIYGSCKILVSKAYRKRALYILEVEPSTQFLHVVIVFCRQTAMTYTAYIGFQLFRAPESMLKLLDL
jgi:hypothetical protein